MTSLIGITLLVSVVGAFWNTVVILQNQKKILDAINTQNLHTVIEKKSPEELVDLVK